MSPSFMHQGTTRPKSESRDFRFRLNIIFADEFQIRTKRTPNPTNNTLEIKQVGHKFHLFDIVFCNFLIAHTKKRPQIEYHSWLFKMADALARNARIESTFSIFRGNIKGTLLINNHMVAFKNHCIPASDMVQ